MNEFYAEMEQRRQLALKEEEKKNIDRWKTCVEAGAVRGIAPREVECKFPAAPQRSTLDKLETPSLKLMAQRIEEYRDPFNGRLIDPAYYIVREQVSCWVNPNCQDHSK